MNETVFLLGDLIVSKKYPGKVVEIINILYEGNKQISVECKIDNYNTYFFDTLKVDTISYYGTEYKVKNLVGEKWFPIPGYDNYQLSNIGRIKSLKPYGNPKFEKILCWSMKFKDVLNEQHKISHYDITFQGVKLYKNNIGDFFYRREIFEKANAFELINDEGYDEVYKNISTREIASLSKDTYLFHKNYGTSGIIWDYVNRLWCFYCKQALGYETWDDFHCFSTNLKKASAIQRILRAFQPRLEERLPNEKVGIKS